MTARSFSERLKRFVNWTPNFQPSGQIAADGFLLTRTQIRGFDCLVVTSATDRGVLYGVFALLSKIARHENVATLNQLEQPQVPIRWIDQWDNLNGTIERGYAGPSIFFEKGNVRADLSRAARIRATARIRRHQWVHHQQRQCRSEDS